MDLATALNELDTHDFFIWDNFLSAAEVTSIIVDYEALRSDGNFKRASIGKGNQRQVDDEIRNDETYWLDPLDLAPIQSLFWNRLEDLKHQINEHLFLGLWSLGGHYSYYPVLGHYRKHLDRFNQDDKRTISMVLYFNTDWKIGDGGELRLHGPDLIDGIQDITPIGGRLICFLSSKVLHEVLTTQKERLSFAGWWNRRPHEIL